MRGIKRNGKINRGIMMKFISTTQCQIPRISLPCVKVGIGVFIFNEAGHVLLGKRINSHGHGTWGLPGGHLEYGETPIECAIREAREETGLILTHLKEGLFTNDIFQEENKH